jgi:hypothetical protein
MKYGVLRPVRNELSAPFDASHALNDALVERALVDSLFFTSAGL